jgi:hypothetical protein
LVSPYREPDSRFRPKRNALLPQATRLVADGVRALSTAPGGSPSLHSANGTRASTKGFTRGGEKA